MAEPFLAEIRLTSFTFAPKGWALCNGQLLPINQNQALFALLGTTYGGNGQTTFALPDLRGRLPLHVGANVLGQRSGSETHTLRVAEMPAHTHPVSASSAAGDAISPAGKVLAMAASTELYAPGPASAALNSGTVGVSGGGQPHSNQSPYLVLNYIIALQGIFPSRI